MVFELENLVPAAFFRRVLKTGTIEGDDCMDFQNDACLANIVRDSELRNNDAADTTMMWFLVFTAVSLAIVTRQFFI